MERYVFTPSVCVCVCVSFRDVVSMIPMVCVDGFSLVFFGSAHWDKQ